ncbi:hypothetical protein NEOLEDRAFT_567346 [Neolentinus lepideus HHB14362 ss-1]|uniref:Uncharacterized protein n=1 Tax=Neolentinus lepideus HHB14362 ss-1 TaxID=1314782 RepID=A0A165QYV9_9AGAM|nr:hypothetical protein NEOLEDRAFT_567346 [Neolentinus lepideus HHB14362 ss-1]
MAYHDDRSHRNYYRREDSNRYHRCPEYPDRDGPGTRHQSGEYWAPTHREHRDIGNNTWYVDYRAQGACASVSYRRKSLLERIEPENRQKWLSLRERITVSSGIPLAQRISTMKVEEPLGNEPELDYSRVHEREETPLPETEPEGDSSSVIEVIDLTMESDTEKEDEESSTMDAPEFEEGEVVEVTSQREVCEIHDEEETVREGRQHQAERNLGAVPGNVDSDPEPWQPSDSLVPLFLVRSEDISSDGPSLATVDDPQSPPPIGVAEMNGPPPLSLSESVTDDVDMNLPETDAHAQNRTYDERREVGEVEQPTSEAEAQMSHDDEDVGDSSPPDENLVVAEPSTTRSPAEQSVGESNPPDKNLVVVEPSTTCSTEKRTSPLVPPLVEAFLDNHIDATAAIGQGPQSPEQNVVLDSNISQLQIIADNPARSTDHLMSHQPTQETEGSLSAALQATRKEMLSLVVRNALFQNPNATFHPEYVEKTLLSDERCLDFMKQSKIVVQQLENRQRQLDVEELRDMSSVDVSSGTKRPLEE